MITERARRRQAREAAARAAIRQAEEAARIEAERQARLIAEAVARAKVDEQRRRIDEAQRQVEEGRKKQVEEDRKKQVEENKKKQEEQLRKAEELRQLNSERKPAQMPAFGQSSDAAPIDIEPIPVGHLDAGQPQTIPPIPNEADLQKASDQRRPKSQDDASPWPQRRNLREGK